MKGIILAGGKGTRLYPLTLTTSKQLLPIYDKPMIYYPLSLLMLIGIKEILIISTPQDLPLYERLLGDGSNYGVELSYKIQEKPRGLADAFILGEEFIGKDSVCLILGDNFFFGSNINIILEEAMTNNKGATIFGYEVVSPNEFGVIEFDKNRNVISIEEKPQHPKSNYAVPGLYFYDNDVIEIAKKIKPSIRGEIEITSINNEYLKKENIKVAVFDKQITWFDIGTLENMKRASSFVENVQKKHGFYIACLEEIAYKQGFISIEQLRERGKTLKESDYGKYLLKICEEKDNL